MKIKLLTLAVLFAFGVCTNYSEGDRVGHITKFSLKGNIFKTYEGELVMGGLRSNGEGGSEANVFRFSLDASRNRGENTQDLSAVIYAAMDTDKKVKLHYHQEQFTNCSGSRGESSYFVTKVEILK